jgi:hypothetical protein
MDPIRRVMWSGHTDGRIMENFAIIRLPTCGLLQNSTGVDDFSKIGLQLVSVYLFGII